METKLSFNEIVPANDILEDEMEFIKGGTTDFNLCLKGCVTGEKSDKNKGNSTFQPTTPTSQTTTPTSQTTTSLPFGN